MAPAVINRLPLVSNLLKWFKGDELTIDNPLFKLHHQVREKITVSKAFFSNNPPNLSGNNLHRDVWPPLYFLGESS